MLFIVRKRLLFKEEVSPLLWEKKVDVTGRWLSSKIDDHRVEVSQRAMRCAKSREVTLPSDSFDPRVAWWRFANDYTAIGT